MNKNLNNAKIIKNDEYYTRYEDIEIELRHYIDQFEDKVVYCNCDDYRWSSFYEFFKNNFVDLKIKKLICTHLEGTYKSECIELTLDNDQLTSNTFKLESGSFSSEQCIEILKESDIVCTNPPFSMFNEFLSLLIEYNKKFLIIGNANAITHKHCFSLIKNNELWWGVTPRGMDFYLDVEKTVTSNVNAVWYTNIEHGNENPFLDLDENVDVGLYQRYVDIDAIEVPKVKDIPGNYYGVMGVPITFLSKYNSNQFEIIDLVTPSILVNGAKKTLYKRFLIKRK